MTFLTAHGPPPAASHGSWGRLRSLRACLIKARAATAESSLVGTASAQGLCNQEGLQSCLLSCTHRALLPRSPLEAQLRAACSCEPWGGSPRRAAQLPQQPVRPRGLLHSSSSALPQPQDTSPGARGCCRSQGEPFQPSFAVRPGTAPPTAASSRGAGSSCSVLLQKPKSCPLAPEMKGTQGDSQLETTPSGRPSSSLHPPAAPRFWPSPWHSLLVVATQPAPG